eukprot:16958_1
MRSKRKAACDRGQHGRINRIHSLTEEEQYAVPPLLAHLCHSSTCIPYRHVATMTIGLTSITLRGEGAKMTAHLPLVTGSHDGSVKIWDIESLMSPKAAADVAELEPLIEFRKPPPPRQRLDLSVSGVAFGRPGFLITAGFDGCLREWSLSSGLQVREKPTGMRTGIASLATYPSADIIVAGGGSGLVEWYSLKTLTFIGSSNHNHQVRSVCMDPMMDSTEDASERKYSVLAGGGKFNIQGPPEGELFLHTVKQREIIDDSVVQPIPMASFPEVEYNSQEVERCDILPITSGPHPHRPLVSDPIIQLKCAKGPAGTGSIVAVGCFDGTVRILSDPFSLDTPAEVARSQKRRKVHHTSDNNECVGDNQYMDWVRMHKAPVTCVAVVDGGEFIVAGGRDGSISLWKFDPKSMKFDKDFFRRTLGVTGGAGNMSGGYVIRDAHPGGVVLDLIITPQLRLISCASDGVIRVWDIRRLIRLQRITMVVLREAYKKEWANRVRRKKNAQVYKKGNSAKEMEIHAGKQSLSHYFRDKNYSLIESIITLPSNIFRHIIMYV